MSELTTWIIAICALTNVVIGITQVMLVPFVKGVRADVKNLSDSVQRQEIILSTGTQLNEINQKSYASLHKRYHDLTDTLNALMLQLAAKGIYTPSGITIPPNTDRC